MDGAAPTAGKGILASVLETHAELGTSWEGPCLKQDKNTLMLWEQKPRGQTCWPGLADGSEKGERGLELR